jgi:hypothetical protein
MVYVSEIQPVNLDMIIITGNQTLVKHPSQLVMYQILCQERRMGYPLKGANHKGVTHATAGNREFATSV